jgi:hypothetical protein
MLIYIKNTLILLLIITLPMSAINIEYSGVSSTYIHNGQKSYTITSKEYINKIDSKHIATFMFNHEQYMLKNNYYKNGYFSFLSVKLHFKKAFKLAGKVYMYNVKGKIDNNTIKAKKAIYFNKTILLKKCEIKSKRKVLRRKEYKINLKNN